MNPATSESERWAAHRREHALESKALEVARGLQEQALSLARDDINRRLEGMNELRVQIDRERGSYMSRVEYEAKHEQIMARIDLASARIQGIETQQAGVLSRLTVVASLAGVAVSVIVTIGLKLLNV